MLAVHPGFMNRLPHILTAVILSLITVSLAL